MSRTGCTGHSEEQIGTCEEWECFDYPERGGGDRARVAPERRHYDGGRIIVQPGETRMSVEAPATYMPDWPVTHGLVTDPARRRRVTPWS